MNTERDCCSQQMLTPPHFFRQLALSVSFGKTSVACSFACFRCPSHNTETLCIIQCWRTNFSTYQVIDSKSMQSSHSKLGISSSPALSLLFSQVFIVKCSARLPTSCAVEAQQFRMSDAAMARGSAVQIFSAAAAVVGLIKHCLCSSC